VKNDKLTVGILTGGGDKPYAHGLLDALVAQRVPLDFICSDDLNDKSVPADAQVTFLNLRGSQDPDVGRVAKVRRILLYYARLLSYAVSSQASIFHILWNNKFQWFDRTVLMLLYKAFGKKLIFTAHNVNAGKRDGNDSIVNRLTLKAQYQLSDHIFVHTHSMRSELCSDFSVPDRKVSVIPFGINNTISVSALSGQGARKSLGLKSNEKVLLFFGNVAPYKGLEYLIEAFVNLCKLDNDYRLVIAGRLKCDSLYWQSIQDTITAGNVREHIIERIEYIPDCDVEIYFKSADVVILPYTHVFQSGVLFLTYSFGRPVIASDVGSIKEDILEGETGFVCKAKDANDLSKVVEEYFVSELFYTRQKKETSIKSYANERYSWDKVGEATVQVYRDMISR
jgi:glycosyltransferase involved in cell wall biosynthesis